MLKSWTIAICGPLVAASVALAQLPGFEIVEITNTPGFFEREPQMNDCGQVVFARGVDLQDDLAEIYLYDNGKTARLTDNNVADRDPDINELGVMTWTQNPDGFGGGTIILYENGDVNEVYSPATSSRINNLGHIAFIVKTDPGCGSGNKDIFFYNGEVIERLTQNAHSNQGVAINDADEIAWTRYNFCAVPWVSDIMLYIADETIEISDKHFEPQNVCLANNGLAVWKTPDVFNAWVDVWQDGKVTRLTSGTGPHPNDLGDIGFSRYDAEDGIGDPWLYDGTNFTRILDTEYHIGVHGVNIYREMLLWINMGFPENELWIMRRIRNGDGNFDKEIDLDDHQSLVDCMTGPFDTDRLCACRFFDLDHDRDVDLRDFRYFQENFVD